MDIALVFSPAAREVHEMHLTVPEGTTLKEALHLAGWLERFPAIKQAPLEVGIWGRKASASTLLRQGDRVEMYRELRVDPKVARRERFVGQGSRGAGLFAQRRPGSKAGY
ncbi:RnfH family protein [Hydrogenophaga sp. A37]|uniref:RnfH family protein n=1 Tax=Hydrogenophaga sp. A37 TaxID=1945864 RepID=UPI00117A4777|nr:RnfH family protein [Hydrogenophaga sp. A37]